MAYASKTKRQQYDREWYDRNKDRIRERKMQSQQEFRGKRSAWLQGKKAAPCTDCKHEFPHYVMQFDHVRGKKEFNISDAVFMKSIGELEKEIEKCELVCANCHAIRTFTRSSASSGSPTLVEAPD